ncbi:MAG: hypothetical protein ACLFTG_05745 [Alphaproteobacteria bacterium]
MPDSPPNYSVATLCEGDYDLGVAAMINSLCRIGYSGKVVVGYRGRRPRLPGELEYRHGSINSNIQVECVLIDWQWHLGNFKARFMIDQIERDDSPCDGIIYVDPDIVFRASWAFFVDWVLSGVAVCSDPKYFRMSINDPKRKKWQNLCLQMNFAFREMSGYVNSGFVGVDRRYAAILHAWMALDAQLFESGQHDRDILVSREVGAPFEYADQDVLNMALHTVDVPVTLAGLEGMGFDGSGSYYMSHAFGRRKPWRGGFIRDALRHGFRPSRAARDFWEHADQPIAVFPKRRIRLMKAEIKTAVVLSRLLS